MTTGRSALIVYEGARHAINSDCLIATEKLRGAVARWAEQFRVRHNIRS